MVYRNASSLNLKGDAVASWSKVDSHQQQKKLDPKVGRDFAIRSENDPSSLGGVCS